MNNIIKNHYIPIICLLLTQTTILASKTPAKPFNFTLDINLVPNSNISSPVISPSPFQLYTGQINNWSTKNRYVQIIDICEAKKKNFFLCPNFYGATCGWQFLDTDSDSNNEIYYQRFIFTEIAEYQLRFDWISEISYLLSSTGISVYWNGKLLESFYSNSCTLSSSVYYVMSSIGANQLAFQGIGIIDSQGILIRNIQLMQIAYIIPVNSGTSNASIANNTSNSSQVNNTNTTLKNGSEVSNQTYPSNSTTNNDTTNINSTQTNSSLNNSTANPENNYPQDSNNSPINSSSNIENSSSTSNNTLETNSPTSSDSNSTLKNSSSIESSNFSSNSSNSSSNSQNSSNSSTDSSNFSSNSQNSSNSSSNSSNSSSNSQNSSNSSSNTNSSQLPNNTIYNNTTPQNRANNSTNNYPPQYEKARTNNTEDTANSFYSYSLSFQDIQYQYNSSQYMSLFAMFKFSQKYSLAKYCSSIFSSQQNIKFLVGFLMELNHMLLYNYHIRNYTLMSNFILVGIQALDDQKALIIDGYIYPALGITPESILQDFSQQNTLPLNAANIVSEYTKRPNGILLQITDLFLVDVPVTLIVFLLGNMLFRLLFNYRLSYLFRQYSLYGLFFFILLNGKIQIITFYFISQLLLMYSSTFLMKIQVAVIVFFFFFIIFTSVGLMILYQSAYRKLTKLIYENCRRPYDSLCYMTFSFGIYNILLGLVHRLFLNFPNLQIYLLTTIELAYLILIIYLVSHRFFENIFLGIVLGIMNLLRIIFNITFMLYQIYPSLETSISQVQQFTFYSLLAAWGLSLLLTIMQKFSLVYRIVRKATKSNRILPQKKSKKVQFKELKSNTALSSRNKFTLRFQKSQQDGQSNYDIVFKQFKFRRANTSNPRLKDREYSQQEHSNNEGEVVVKIEQQKIRSTKRHALIY